MDKGSKRGLPPVLFGMTLVAILFFTATAPASKAAMETMPGDPLRGITLFVEKSCVNCHTIWGEGGESFGPDLAQVAKGRSFYQLIGLLWSHSPKMVASMERMGIKRPDLDAAEMADIISYLYFLNFFDPPGDISLGRRAFTDKGCSICHQVGGHGGTEGPALDHLAWMMSPVYIATEMWNHSSVMDRRMTDRGLEMPSFQGREIADILAYIRSASSSGEGERKYMVPGNPQEGQRVFDEKGCSDCHAVWGRGADVASDLGEIRLYRSVSEVAGLMWNHSREMADALEEKHRKAISFMPEEMNHLLAYIYFLNFVDEPGSPERGRILFDKKACSACHSVYLDQEKLGPNLSRADAATSSMKLAAKMWEHAPRMADMLDELGLSWPQFSGDEMRDLVAFLHETSQQTGDN